MKEIRVYTWKLAEFLTGKGFQYKRMVQDVALVNYKIGFLKILRKSERRYKITKRAGGKLKCQLH